MNTQIILGIETSCDDTSVAIIQGNRVLSNVTFNQKIHQKYGGVVPEWASRKHQSTIVPVIDTALQEANIHQNDISAIAFTQGPGLIGSLLVGNSFAKSLSLAWNIPLIAVNHLQAHVLAHFIEDANPHPPQFPFICLLVSGGHTQLILLKSLTDWEIIGQTRDDAAGEAFDKIGKILGLPYPAGPEIDKLSQGADNQKFTFSIPQVEGLDFSYSGLKTSVLYFINKILKEQNHFIEENLHDVCASVQQVIVESMMQKLDAAVQQYGVKHAAIAGGVSANSALRNAVQSWGLENNIEVYIPKFSYTTDNAAMIAMVGSIKYENKEFVSLDVTSYAR